MSEPKKLPVFLGEGDERIQIGEALVEDWGQNLGAENYKKILMHVDVFPGEIATLSRVASWDEIESISKYKYPKGE